ncbi:MAG: class I SAM-dependent methyltransferase [Candidatus Woesearchaeota archaeon]
MSHYYSEKQQSNSNQFKINIKHKQDEFELISAHGVFSKKKLDLGSKLLIEKCLVKKGQKVLDLGCGIGVIGISLLRLNSLNMTFSDVNERALSLVNKNLKKHSLNAKVIKSDVFNSIEDKFDVILSNPPYAAGRKLCFDIITQSFNNLEEDGSLQLVARHNKGGKVLGEKIQEVFGNLEILGKGSGFRVYMGKKVR